MQADLEERRTALAGAEAARQALSTELATAHAELAEARGSAAEAGRDRDRAREQHADAQKQVGWCLGGHAPPFFTKEVDFWHCTGLGRLGG